MGTYSLLTEWNKELIFFLICLNILFKQLTIHLSCKPSFQVTNHQSNKSSKKTNDGQPNQPNIRPLNQKPVQATNQPTKNPSKQPTVPEQKRELVL